MKGIVALALRELVNKDFGNAKWKEILEGAGIKEEPVILAVSDIDDELILKIIGSLCTCLGITFTQAAEAFGNHWVCTYTPRIYKGHFAGITSAKDLLLKLDSIHVALTKNLANAQPPRFDYKWKNEKTLHMKYKSHRNLIDFAVCLVKSAGKLYNEELKVTHIGDNVIEVVFP